MRVLFFNYEYPPLGGGAGNATSYILKEFSKIPGLEIDLVTSSTGEFRSEKISENITIHFLDISKKGNLHYQSFRDLIVYSWKAYFYGKKLSRQKKYDICHAFFGIPCGYIAEKMKIPYIVSLRGSDVPFYNCRFYFPDKYIFKKLSRQIWKKAAAVVALSHDLVKIARVTSKDQKIEIIYNGINTDEFCPDSEILSKEKNFNILFVGRLIERKGFIYLLEAFSRFSRAYDKARLIVAGDGPLRNFFVKLAKEKNISEKIDFVGIVDHQKISQIYKRAHVFVIPSLNEALGNVTQEALASGLPVITTETGAAELINGNGIIIPKESSKDIEEALTRIINDQELRRKMGQESRQKALGMSWKSVADEYYKLYEKIL